MKKIVIVLLSLLLVASITGCDSDDTNIVEPAEDTEIVYADILQIAIDGGIIDVSTAVLLTNYLDENDPNNQEQGTEGEPSDILNPFTAAAEEGIITEEQAVELENVVELTGPMNSEGAEADSPMANTSEMLSVDEANAIEAQLVEAVGYSAAVDGYKIVDTNQTRFFSNDGIINEPAEGEDFYGQDSSFTGNAPSYTDNGDGTITDNVTGLVWQQDPGEKLDWEAAVNGLDEFNYVW